MSTTQREAQENYLRELERISDLCMEAHLHDANTLVRRDNNLWKMSVLGTIGVLVSGGVSLFPVWESNPRLKFINIGLATLLSSILSIGSYNAMRPARIKLNRTYAFKYESLKYKTETFRTFKLPQIQDPEQIAKRIQELDSEQQSITMNAPEFYDINSYEIKMKMFEPSK